MYNHENIEARDESMHKRFPLIPAEEVRVASVRSLITKGHGCKKWK